MAISGLGLVVCVELCGCLCWADKSLLSWGKGVGVGGTERFLFGTTVAKRYTCAIGLEIEPCKRYMETTLCVCYLQHPLLGVAPLFDSVRLAGEVSWERHDIIVFQGSTLFISDITRPVLLRNALGCNCES